MYLVCNNNLLFHASIPLNADGSFKEVTILGEKFAGKRLLDRVDQLVRAAFFDDNNDTTSFALDYLWYLWCGPDSPLFDKDKMATFERYFVADKELHKEEKVHTTLFATARTFATKSFRSSASTTLIRT